MLGRFYRPANTWSCLLSHLYRARTPQVSVQCRNGADWDSCPIKWYQRNGMGDVYRFFSLGDNGFGIQEKTVETKICMEAVGKGIVSDTDYGIPNGLSEWLEQKIGMNEDETQKVLQSKSNLRDLDVDGKVVPFVRMIVEHQYPLEQVRKMIWRYPPVISHANEFEELVSGLRTAGIDRCERDFVSMLLRQPQIVSLSFNGEIQPKLQLFLEFGFKPKDIGSMLHAAPEILRLSLENNIKPKLERFAKVGASNADINVILVQAPQLIVRDFQEFVQKKLDWLKTECRVDPDVALKCLVGKPILFTVGLRGWKKDLKAVKSAFCI